MAARGHSPFWAPATSPRCRGGPPFPLEGGHLGRRLGDRAHPAWPQPGWLATSQTISHISAAAGDPSGFLLGLSRPNRTAGRVHTRVRLCLLAAESLCLGSMVSRKPTDVYYHPPGFLPGVRPAGALAGVRGQGPGFPQKVGEGGAQFPPRWRGFEESEENNMLAVHGEP